MKTPRLLISLAVLVPLALVLASAGASRSGRNCTNESLEGRFGYTAAATVHAPPGSPTMVAHIAAVGRFVADGEGNITGHDVGNVNGVATPRTLTATYSVNPDCTGEVDVTFVPTLRTSYFFVIVEDGEQIRMVQKTPGILGTVEAIAQD